MPATTSIVTVDELVSLFTGTIDDDGSFITCPPRRDANAIVLIVAICRRTKPVTELALAHLIFGADWPPDTIDHDRRELVRLGWERWVATGKPST